MKINRSDVRFRKVKTGPKSRTHYFINIVKVPTAIVIAKRNWKWSWAYIDDIEGGFDTRIDAAIAALKAHGIEVAP